MSRYVDFYLIGELVDSHGNVHYEDLKNLPTADVVEVVRCKDCKHGEIDDEDFPEQYLCRHHGSAWNEGNHFCSYGERREDDKE